MTLSRGFSRVVVGVMAAATLLVVTATPSPAQRPPFDPVPVSLTCGEGTYSYVQVLQLLDHKDNVVGTANLECGTGWNTIYPTQGYPSGVAATVSGRVTGYSLVEWLCTNTTDPIGGYATQPVGMPLAKRGSTTIRCAEPATTGGSDVTLTIG